MQVTNEGKKYYPAVVAALTAKIGALKWVKFDAANAVIAEVRCAKWLTMGNCSCWGYMFCMLLNESKVLNVK